MTVRLRAALDSIPSYVAGRAIPGAIKLASNETSFGPLPHVLARLQSVLEGTNRYPDNFSTQLTQTLADRHGVSAQQVTVGCGSVSLCHQLVEIAVDADDEVLFAWRSFETYPIATAIGGGRAVPIPLTAEGAHDLSAMAGAITDRTRLIFVCSPNNPTGVAVTEAGLRAFLAQVPADVLVVLDSAYQEFVRDPEVVDGIALLGEFANLVVLRTFSKAYGLAGLRVGYAVAADERVTLALRQTQVPFAVTALAQTAALASLEPQAEAQLMDRVEATVAERTRVIARLRALGYRLPESQANFVWLPLGAATMAFSAGCDERKVTVRAFAGDGVRVTIGLPEENDAFLAAAAELAGLAG